MIADAVRLVDTAAPVDHTLDNTATSGVIVSGGWTPATTTAGYHGSNYLHDGGTGQGTKTVWFGPSGLPAGTYRVYGRWTAFSNRATNAPIDVAHAGGLDLMTVNQTIDGGRWVELDTYEIEAAP